MYTRENENSRWRKDGKEGRIYTNSESDLDLELTIYESELTLKT